MRIAWQNIARNFWLSFMTVSMYVLTLLTINSVLLINVLAQQIVTHVEDKVEVSVYFKPDASLDIVKNTQNYLLALSQVKDAKIITAEDALTSFKEEYKDDQAILASLDEISGNPFGSAIVVRANSPKDFDFILKSLDSPQFTPYIEDKSAIDNADIIANVTKVASQLQLGGLLLAIFFAWIALLIMFNTIRVAIYVHRDEVSIMKLVGASDGFVRAPFIIEGVIYSLLSCAIVFGCAWVFLRAGISLPPWFTGLDLLAAIQSYYLPALAVEVAVTVLISSLATSLALRRFLKV